jgi:uncharacterized paraquat-inducible protein A
MQKKISSSLLILLFLTQIGCVLNLMGEFYLESAQRLLTEMKKTHLLFFLSAFTFLITWALLKIITMVSKLIAVAVIYLGVLVFSFSIIKNATIGFVIPFLSLVTFLYFALYTSVQIFTKKLYLPFIRKLRFFEHILEPKTEAFMQSQMEWWSLVFFSAITVAIAMIF